MAFLLLLPQRDTSDLVLALKKRKADLDIRIWPDVGNGDDIDYAVVWNHPRGELAKYPNLKVIASYGAGVDHIFRDPELPDHLSITRLTDDSLTKQMAEYVTGAILNHRLRLTEYREYQAATSWTPLAPRPGTSVCLLGLGNIGQEVAHSLNLLNFTICGWSQSAKNIPNVKSYHGNDQLPDALKNADYVVCLLPLTPATENILDGKLFQMMKKGSYLINAGRGAQLNEDDLLDALYQGQLSGACLDVFRQEPLPQDHPFWRHPRIMITPHIASLTDTDKAADQLLKNYDNMKNSHSLSNLVDRKKGY